MARMLGEKGNTEDAQDEMEKSALGPSGRAGESEHQDITDSLCFTIEQPL